MFFFWKSNVFKTFSIGKFISIKKEIIVKLFKGFPYKKLKFKYQANYRYIYNTTNSTFMNTCRYIVSQHAAQFTKVQSFCTVSSKIENYNSLAVYKQKVALTYIFQILVASTFTGTLHFEQ